jgi:ribosome-binding factor A
MDRMARINELLKRELGDIFKRRVCTAIDCLITITEVKTSPDLHQAQVYVSVYGSKEQSYSVLKLLHKKRRDIQNEMSRHVKIKYTPVLQFHLDGKLDEADRIMKLLEGLDVDEDNEIQS